jgi:hypothetical protein
VVSLAKAHVSLYPVVKASEDSTEEVHEQHTQRVARRGKGVEIEVPAARG